MSGAATCPTSRRRRRSASTAATPPRSASTIRTTGTGCWGQWKTTRARMRSTASCGARSGRAPSPTCSARATAAAARDRGTSPASASFASARPRRAASIRHARARDSRRWRHSCRTDAQGKRPVDGYYVTLWRLMLRYPELLAWEMLWTDSLRETYAAMYAKVKIDQAVDRRRLAHLAQQLVQPDLSRGAGSFGTDEILRFPEDGDVSQLRRRAHGELYRQRGRAPSTAMSRSRNCSTSTIACWTTRGEAARRDSQSGPVRGLRLPRGEAGPRSAERDEDAAVAGYRHRHPHRGRRRANPPPKAPGTPWWQRCGQARMAFCFRANIPR